ncbi:214903ab-4607-4ca1-a9af-db8f783b316c-CDS [Sclerotinia trifoliorum]|uniref:214903ab-4607-4ca1-a9af-db8f783b316c-CDS n=1 Tax=Sclerotinia trifoliorum TaxID=28548 RepID=A0A8H2ZYG6_9HELO|nr:214903ab-4607-4ca1-a9af-db8f783b316c-CDS [Sclerotinia trifoliorum]
MQKFLEPLVPQPRTTIAGKINIPSPSDKLSEFTSTSLNLLTQLLRLTPGTLPNDPWLHEQETLLATFPQCLLHPKSSGLIYRVAASISSLRLGETKAILCPVHKPLNPYLIRKIFLEVTAECTTRIQRLASEPIDELPVNVGEFVVRMQRLNSIWMQPEFYRQAYQVLPSEPRYERVGSGCEACILATIGGNRNIVRDLFASIWGRRRKNREMKGWIDVVRAWEGWHENFDALTLESTGLGSEIVRCRKRLQTLRKAAMREQLQGMKNPLDRDSEAQTLLGHYFSEGDGDVENEIVDFYANMMSRTSFANTSTQSAYPAEEVHAAFRDTVTYTDGFFHSVSRPVKEINALDYSHGALNALQISQDGVGGRASAYRHLVGIEESLAAESDEDDKPQFTNPFADPPETNHHAYRGSYYENSRASPSPPSPRTMNYGNKPKEKAAPRHRRPDPHVNPFSRSSHVANPEVKRTDRRTRCSDFMK